MKVGVALLLVCVAVFARAQDLQYESATYSDAAAPAPFEEQPMNAVAEEAVAEEESSPEMTLDVAEQDPAFAETDASSEPGALSRAAHRVGQQIRRVKKLFHKRKHAGGNISPSRRVAAPPKPHHKKHHKKPVAAARAAALKAKVLKKPIIAAPKAPAKAKAAAKKAKKAAKKAAHKAAIAAKKAKLLAKKKKHSRRIPRAPAAARGPVDNLFHEERLEQKGENRDPEMAKLNLALNAVKEDILSTNKQINDERRWVIAVSKIINSYNNKMKRVEGHIIALRKEMKALYRKKKQIENLKLQRALEAKLKEAKAELLTLRNSLKHVAVKQGELNKSGRDLRATIRGIQGQLLKLRGKSKKCPRGSRLSLKSKKCVSVCKKGTRFSRRAGKCVRRCKKGTRFSRKHKKCVRAKKGRSARRSRKAGRKHGKHGRKHAPRRK